MQNFSCTKCGSNKLRPDGENYRCEYCGATILKPISFPKKRVIFILSALTVLLIVSFMVYKLLYAVKSDLEQLKASQSTAQYHASDTQTQTQQDVPYQEKNPYSDVILKSEKGYNPQTNANALEQSIKVYQDQETNKAFYISLDKNGGYAFGYAYAAKSIKEAEDQALKLCESEKKKRNLPESCIPYAVNDNVSRLMIGW